MSDLQDYSARLFEAAEGLPSLDWCERVADSARQAAATIAVEMSESNQPERDDVPALWSRVAGLVEEVGGLIRAFCTAAEEYAPGAGLSVSVDAGVPAWADWRPGTVPAPGAPSVAEYAATLRAVAEALPAQLFAAAASAAEGAAGEICFRASETNVEHFGDAVDRLPSATGLLTDAAGLATAAAELIEAYCSDPDRLGARAGGSARPPGEATPGPGGAAAVIPAPPQSVAEAGRRLPVRRGRRDKTVGVFNGEQIVSGDDWTSVDGLKPFRLGGWPVVLLAHVESHAAARMRRQGLTSGTLVLNNLVCGNRDYDRDLEGTCERHLSSVLLAGSSLTVWATEDGGDTWWAKTYVGTGERIQP